MARRAGDRPFVVPHASPFRSTTRPSPAVRLALGSNTVSPVDLIRRIDAAHGEFLLFAITPPRLATDHERAQEIADATVARLRPLDLDGLILYDIDDETDRNPAERPFPFTPTLDPADYLADHLGAWPTPVIVYRAVSKYAPAELRTWLSAQDPARVMTVLVGASVERHDEGGRHSPTLRRCAARPTRPCLLGGVAIPERHSRREDEHLRLLAKQDAGCRFFVTQVVYDVNAAKNLVSDYHYECQARGVSPVPFVFTFSVCGSMKTLDVSAVAGCRRTEVDRERPQARHRPARGLVSASPRDRQRTDRLLPQARRALRNQRRKRLDPTGRDRSRGATRRTASNTVEDLVAG